jgi:hypothetical protein
MSSLDKNITPHRKNKPEISYTIFLVSYRFSSELVDYRVAKIREIPGLDITINYLR